MVKNETDVRQINRNKATYQSRTMLMIVRRRGWFVVWAKAGKIYYRSAANQGS